MPAPGEFDRLISSLGKRVFLYHNVHDKKPSIFHTRWVMNYLAGPLTISQIPDLNALAGAQPYTLGSSTKARKDAKITHSRSTDRPISIKPSSTKQNIRISHFGIVWRN
jgi:hypothetical protein